MKELEVTLRVRNNRLKQRRDDLGFSQGQLAEAIGISIQNYGALECMTLSPLDPSTGDWRKTVLALARFHCVEPEELFPPGVVNLTKPRAIRKLDTSDLRTMLHGDDAPAPGKLIEASQDASMTSKAIAILNTQEANVIRMRFGFEGEPMTYADIAEKLDRSVERVRQIEMRAVGKLRKLKGFMKSVAR